VRIAVVDIGANSTRLLIADVVDRRVTDELVRRTTVTRLGAGVDADRRLRDDAIQRVYTTLDEYRATIDRGGVDRRLAVLTSAVRDAANGSEFVTGVEQRYGLPTHVLTGEEEAQLTFLGATSHRDPDDTTTTLVIDVGGGSTELVIGAGSMVTFHVSTQAGVVRQSERHIDADPPTEPQLDELTRDVRSTLTRAVPPEQRGIVGHAIAVAGTATSLAAIAQDLEPYDPDKVEGYLLSRAQCEQILARLTPMTLGQRGEVRGLHPDRAPTIVAGIVIVLAVLSLFELDRVEVSEHDILHGAALGLGSATARDRANSQV